MADNVDLTYSIGTVSIAAGDTIITGVGTLWQDVNARQWDAIQIGNSNTLIPITEVTDSTHLKIPTWQGTTQTNVAYVLYKTSPLRYVGGKAMADVDNMLSVLNTEGWYRYVNPIYASPTAQGIVANEGQFALKYTTGELWIMSGGVWVLVGVYKGISSKGVWSSATAYNTNDLVSYNGSSYLAIQSGTNHLPTDTAYWQLFAAKGDLGPATLTPIAAWTTATAYVTGPPASYVSINGSSYACAVAHTSGTFATDLATGKWLIVAVKGTDAPTYGGTSTTSLAIATGTKPFVTQSGLAYQNGARVRASSAANVSNWMEGVATYAGPALTITVDKINGSGTFADWNFNIVGQPGAGDLSSANNLSDLGNIGTARSNLGLGNSAVLNVGTTASTVAAGDDGRITGAAQKANNLNDLASADGARSNLGIVGYNLIDNANFRINQRGYASGGAIGAGLYAHDRWKGGAAGGGQYTFTQSVTGAMPTIASGKTIVQVIENVKVIGGSYILSWSGSSQGRVGVNSATPSGTYANSPILITGQTAGIAMSVEFNNGTLTNVKLERGTINSPFDIINYEEEIRQCRRYYRPNGQVMISCYTANIGLASFDFTSNPMRIAPVGLYTLVATGMITIPGIAIANITGLPSFTGTADGGVLTVNHSSASTGTGFLSNNSVAFECEL